MYFITLCTRDRLHLFGEIVAGKMRLNDAGKMVAECWYDLPNHYCNMFLDVFVIMPDPFHGIVDFTDTVDTKHTENTDDNGG